MISGEDKTILLSIARESIKFFLEKKKKFKYTGKKSETLQQQLGVFVTLHMKNGGLRGCIGHIESKLPLFETVSMMAVASAVEDPRFPPLVLEELDEVIIEISVLSPLQKVSRHRDIILGKHGILVKKGCRSGVFLPQVASETGWNREKLLSELCAEKAGLSQDAWKEPDTELYVFTAEIFSENE